VFVLTCDVFLGGFHTVSVMNDVIGNGELDIIGLGRPFTLDPELPKHILEGFLARVPRFGVQNYY